MLNTITRESMMVKEEMNWSEILWCNKYATQVVLYGRKNGIDISTPCGAENAIRMHEAEGRSLKEQHGCDIAEYMDTIIDNIGMIVEK